KPGRPPRHGREFKLADEKTWPAPHVTTVTATTRYGAAAASSRTWSWGWTPQARRNTSLRSHSSAS
ncbi:MAG: hypothetical protein ACM32E_06275, partial [Gemmatimonadota bacterium]